MISLYSYDFGSVPWHPENLPWDAVSRILDVAEPDGVVRDENGNAVVVFKLRKAIKGKPAGAVLPLAKLHALLFPR